MNRRPTIFVGSSSEGLEVANAFQVVLEGQLDCEVQVWNQGTFVAGLHSMQALREQALKVDFAVLVMTPDDVTESRGMVGTAPRDNVLFELGLFMGALGVERVFMLTPRDDGMKVPSDLLGITRLSPYDADRVDRNLLAALTRAAMDARQAIERHGSRAAPSGRLATSSPSAQVKVEDARALTTELGMIRASAEAQGWRVLSAGPGTTLRLLSQKKKRFTFVIVEDAARARGELRRFAGELRAGGLRVNQRVRTRLD